MGRRGRIPEGSYYKGKVVCEDCGDCGKDVMGLLTWDRGALFSYNRIINLEFYEIPVEWGYWIQIKGINDQIVRAFSEK